MEENQNGSIDFTIYSAQQPETEIDEVPAINLFGEEEQKNEPEPEPVYTNYYHPIVPVKPKKSHRKAKIATVVACCMLLSFGAGFGGSQLSLQLNDNAGKAGGGNKVIYQSVTRTDQNGKTAGTLSVAEIAALAANSVVEITTEVVTNGSRLGQFVSKGAGSGVVVTADGYIVTNNHVIDGATKITVRLKNGKEYGALLVGTDTKTDLAVIKINEAGLQPAVFGKSVALQVGDSAVAIGNPLGELGGTVTNGIISALDREITIDGEAMTLLQTNAEINPGNSGGGLFNEKGELIGIVNAKSSGSDVEGIGFAIPIDIASPVVKELIENGYVTGRISLGLELVDVSDATTAMMYRVNRIGVYVSKVTNSSLDFKPGDLIYRIDGTEIAASSEITALLHKYKVGDTLSVVVIRSNKQVTVPLKLAEYVPANSGTAG